MVSAVLKLSLQTVVLKTSLCLSSITKRKRLRWFRGIVLALGTQVREFKLGRSRRIFKGKKILNTPSFGGEVKLSVSCRRFAACKRSIELGGSQILGGICRNISRPRRVPPSAAGGLSRRWTWRHLAEKVETSKGGGKKWQPTPRNLPRMQSARAIPVAWLGSGSLKILPISTNFFGKCTRLLNTGRKAKSALYKQ